jgi:hypothetical protein
MRGTIGIGGMVLALAFSGCVKDEIPVPKQPRGDAQEGVAHIGTDYGSQVWYDLATNSVVSVNSKMDWDLAFECAGNGWLVRLNTARNMRARPTGQSDITVPTDTTGYGSTWKIDLSDGRRDSTALGDWRTDHPVYAIDMGTNVAGLPIGVRKLQVVDVSTSSYHFRAAALDGSNVQDFTVQKDPARSYAYFSFTSGGTVTIAPPLGSYDMVFTQYTNQFYAPDPHIAYLVTGTVNGFSGARVAQITGDFANVSLDDTLNNPFSTDEDVIGYDWKTYSFETSTYTINTDDIYIVRTCSGYFFKLHFIDFYDDQGQRGSPKFEFVAL